MEPWQLNEDNDGQEQPLGLGAPSLVGLSGRKKEKERGWAKKHQGKIREVSKYVQVFCSLFFFFYNERFKTWRLVDCHSVLQGKGKAGQQRVGAEGTCGGAADSYQGLLNQKLLSSWEVFAPLHWHSEFTTRFLIKLVFTKRSKSQWSWILTSLPLKCCTLTPFTAVGGCSKTRCIYKALSFCLQTKHA